MLLYRGSTGVVTAVLNGLIPIYYRKPNEDINIDPIFRLKDFRKVISNQKDFIQIINTNFFPSIKETVSAIKFCKNYFTNQERNKTNLIFNTILNKK
jgi:hypothetical protein